MSTLKVLTGVHFNTGDVAFHILFFKSLVVHLDLLIG